MAGAVAAALAVGACRSSDGAGGESPSTAAEVATTQPGTVPPVSSTPSITVPLPTPVFVFAAPGSIDGWRATNDTVMGGVSVGGVSWAGGAMVFAGELSLDNNGGFASVVSPAVAVPSWASPEGLTVDAVGDGRTYTVQVRTPSGYWVQELATTAGVGERVVLAWSGFEPVNRFLDPVPAPGPLDPSTVASLAIYLVDGQPGPFELAVRALG